MTATSRFGFERHGGGPSVRRSRLPTPPSSRRQSARSVQQGALDVEQSEEVDRNPNGQSSGQGQHQLHREPAVLSTDFPARTLDLNPHPLLLDLFSETTACHPPAIDWALHEIALAAKAYTKLNLQFLKYPLLSSRASGIASLS